MPTGKGGHGFLLGDHVSDRGEGLLVADLDVHREKDADLQSAPEKIGISVGVGHNFDNPPLADH